MRSAVQDPDIVGETLQDLKTLNNKKKKSAKLIKKGGRLYAAKSPGVFTVLNKYEQKSVVW